MNYVIEMTRTATVRTLKNQINTILQSISFILQSEDQDTIDEKMIKIIEDNNIHDSYWEADNIFTYQEYIETTNISYTTTLIPLLTYADITDIEEEE